jgi:hypothetical protein
MHLAVCGGVVSRCAKVQLLGMIFINADCIKAISSGGTTTGCNGTHALERLLIKASCCTMRGCWGNKGSGWMPSLKPVMQKVVKGDFDPDKQSWQKYFTLFVLLRWLS